MSERQEGDGKVVEEEEEQEMQEVWMGGKGRERWSRRGGNMAGNKHSPN